MAQGGSLGKRDSPSRPASVDADTAQGSVACYTDVQFRRHCRQPFYAGADSSILLQFQPAQPWRQPVQIELLKERGELNTGGWGAQYSDLVPHVFVLLMYMAAENCPDLGEAVDYLKKLTGLSSAILSIHALPIGSGW